MFAVCRALLLGLLVTGGFAVASLMAGAKAAGDTDDEVDSLTCSNDGVASLALFRCGRSDDDPSTATSALTSTIRSATDALQPVTQVSDDVARAGRAETGELPVGDLSAGEVIETAVSDSLSSLSSATAAVDEVVGTAGETAHAIAPEVDNAAGTVIAPATEPVRSTVSAVSTRTVQPVTRTVASVVAPEAPGVTVRPTVSDTSNAAPTPLSAVFGPSVPDADAIAALADLAGKPAGGTERPGVDNSGSDSLPAGSPTNFPAAPFAPAGPGTGSVSGNGGGAPVIGFVADSLPADSLVMARALDPAQRFSVRDRADDPSVSPD